MTSAADMLRAADEIRPYLTELLPPQEAQGLSHRLDLALESYPSSVEQSAEVGNILASYETTQAWLNLYLEGKRPTDSLVQLVRTYQPLPGRSEAIASPRYRCPVASCQQVWYRRAVSSDIPNCPIHGVQMVRDSKVTAE